MHGTIDENPGGGLNICNGNCHGMLNWFRSGGWNKVCDNDQSIQYTNYYSTSTPQLAVKLVCASETVPLASHGRQKQPDRTLLKCHTMEAANPR
jgi:hypothetical protein